LTFFLSVSPCGFPYTSISLPFFFFPRLSIVAIILRRDFIPSASWFLPGQNGSLSVQLCFFLLGNLASHSEWFLRNRNYVKFSQLSLLADCLNSLHLSFASRLYSLNTAQLRAILFVDLSFSFPSILLRAIGTTLCIET